MGIERDGKVLFVLVAVIAFSFVYVSYFDDVSVSGNQVRVSYSNSVSGGNNTNGTGNSTIGAIGNRIGTGLILRSNLL